MGFHNAIGQDGLIVGEAMTALEVGLADGQGFLSTTGLACHVVATLAAFTAWRVAKRRRLYSPAALTWLDAAGTVGVCLAFATMGHFLRQPFGFYTALLALDKRVLVLHQRCGTGLEVGVELTRGTPVTGNVDLALL